MTELKAEDNPKKTFTSPLDTIFGLNFSCVSFCLERPISVSATDFAFFENHRVTTIIPPAINNKRGSAGTFLSRTSIENKEGSIPETLHASYEWYAAIETPIKFTKSLPEKASANPNVPTKIITSKILFCEIF